MNTIELNGRPPFSIPAESHIGVFLDPSYTGPQTVVLQQNSRRVEISLKPEPPQALAMAPSSPPQDPTAVLVAQCQQAAFFIRSRELITPRNAKTGLRRWEEWKKAHQSAWDASPQLRGAYKDVLIAIRTRTAGDPH